MKLYVLDGRHLWHKPLIAAAKARGHQAMRIYAAEDAHFTGPVYSAPEPGYCFVRPEAEPLLLAQHRAAFSKLAASHMTIQDRAQMEVYENKTEQWRRWAYWMPPTWLFKDRKRALRFVKTAKYPLVSKANEGASSVNVRILKDRKMAEAHVEEVFGKGVVVRHCSRDATSLQRDYLLFQEFIPHNITYRVNRVGRYMAGFQRYCYASKPVAQTGNVEPIMDWSPSLFAYAERVFNDIGSKWCALDILKYGDEWRLLETSLAWPWPSPGECDEAPFFGTKYRWDGMWELLLDEIEGGVWDS